MREAGAHLLWSESAVIGGGENPHHLKRYPLWRMWLPKRAFTVIRGSSSAEEPTLRAPTLRALAAKFGVIGGRNQQNKATKVTTYVMLLSYLSLSALPQPAAAQASFSGLPPTPSLPFAPAAPAAMPTCSCRSPTLRLLQPCLKLHTLTMHSPTRAR